MKQTINLRSSSVNNRNVIKTYLMAIHLSLNEARASLNLLRTTVATSLVVNQNRKFINHYLLLNYINLQYVSLMHSIHII